MLLYDFDYFSKISHGSIFQGITINDLKSLSIPYCSLSKQDEVITILDSKIKVLNKLKYYQFLLGHLDEYETSLLYETFHNLS